VRAPFFGQDASFPAGPFLMASVLRCPVYLVFGIYRAPNHYDLHCERFAERVELPRKDRDEALRQWVRRYAERVEHYAREAPENWFNFFDFWAAPPNAAPAAPTPPKPTP
jgi:predicted LPLAT superfamily acyltransferase